MNAPVTLLPTELYVKAQAWAKQSGRPLAEFLTETIEATLLPFDPSPISLEAWNDQDLLALIDIQLDTSDDMQLSELLARQKSDRLTARESVQLSQLMLEYQHKLLLKSAALREAVKRGIATPPQP